jgi:hypothetical protein
MDRFDYVKTRDQLGRPEDQGFFTKRFVENVKIFESPTVISQKNISGGSVYGNPVYGIYGTSKYGVSSTAPSFILGNPVYGILGTSKLGEGDAEGEVIVSVVSTNNTYYDPFTTTLFVDDDYTTALVGSGSAEFSVGSALVSLPVYKDTAQISKASIVVTQDGTDLDLYLSNSGTANFEAVLNNSEHNFAVAGTELIWKAEATSGTAKLTKVIIKYE